MAKNKTTENVQSVTAFINALKDETKRDDSFKIIYLMTTATGYQAKMWGPSIVGFGSIHYVYESGREGDMPIVCFSPRSTALVFYLSANFPKREELLQKFGKHTTGKGCVYVKKLGDIDLAILQKMIIATVKGRISLYPLSEPK